MKTEWFFVLVFAAMAAVFLWELNKAGNRIAEFMPMTIEAFKEHDQEMFELHNRIQMLEKERGLYRRVRDLEKQLRALCVDGITEMCGKMTVIGETP